MRNRTTDRPAIEHLGNAGTGMHREVFTISDAALGHITDMLSTFYQSGSYGCMREQISNGWDAALEADVTPRIDVSIAGRFQDVQQVVIKDNGCGMSLAHFKRYYCGYGESSKLHSENQAGMFGVGAKSWLALSDTATIRTVTMDGEQTIGILSQDEDGRVVADIPDNQVTVDPSEHGTTVTIPLQDHRQSAEVESAVRRAAFAYPSNTVYLNGEALKTLANEVESTEAVRHGNLYFLNEQSRWEGSLNFLNVLQGGIIYPVDNDWLADDELSDVPLSDALLRGGYFYGRVGAIIMELPHDSVLPTPQRDGIRDTRRNRRVIVEKFKEAINAMVAERQAQYNAQTWGDAIMSHTNFTGMFSGFKEGTFNWNGKTISSVIDFREMEGGNRTIFCKHEGRKAAPAANFEARHLENLTVYRGFTPDDLSSRKFIYHYNTPIRTGNRSTVYFAILPENDTEGFEYEWLSVGKEDSPEYSEYTREEVYAVQPRATRSSQNRQSYSPTLYDLYVFDAEGDMGVQSVPLKDVPSDVQFIAQVEDKVHMLREDKILKGRTVLGLRNRQSASTFEKRRPNAERLDLNDLYRDKMESELLTEPMQVFMTERTHLLRDRMFNNLKRVTGELPQSSEVRQRLEAITELSDQWSQLGETYRWWANRASILNSVQEEICKPRESFGTWFRENYPLASMFAHNCYDIGEDHNAMGKKHVIMYINAVEAEEE